MLTRAARLACWAIIALGALAALAACAFRVRLELADRTVAVVLDYRELRALGAVSGAPTTEVLARMRKAGATGVALTEETLRDALAGGDVYSVPVRPQDMTVMGPPAGAWAGSLAVISRLHRSLVERLGIGRRAAQTTPEGASAMRVSVWGVPLTDLGDLGIGYSPRGPVEIRQAGLEVVARPRAEGNQWVAASEAALKLAQQAGAKLVVFSGNAALGYPDDLGGVAASIRQNGLVYGYVEFGKQYGDAGLAARLPGDFLRVHSINETEMLGMSVRRAIDRFVLGVRERNIRVCYVRLFPPSGKDPLASAEAYVRELCDEVKSHGFALGSPQPLQPQTLSPLLRWLAGLGALAAVALCLLELLGCRPGPTLIGLAALAALVSLGAFGSLNAATKLCALLSALALPVLAICGIHPGSAEALTRWRALGRGLLSFFTASGVSILGGGLIVACLADTRYMLKLDQFSGVKLAHIVPLLGVIVVELGWDLGSRRAAEGEPRIVTLVRGWREGAAAVIRYWHAVVFLLCAVAIGLMVVRSGNEAGSSVPGLELTFRSLLNHVFGVRPRTKEVLIGHPLLVLAFARMAGGKNTGRWLLLGLGAIGQISIVNTFTHLHTPLAVSVERTLHGLWAGALVGVALYAAVEFGERLWERWRGASDTEA